MKKNFKTLIATGVLLLAPVLFTGWYDKEFEWSKNLEIYHSMVRELEMYYVDETDPGRLIRTSIDKMLQTLDPYTVYVPESQTEDLQLMTTGEYGGVGATIGQDSTSVFISDPYEGSPAANAGLRAGDIIRKVDERSVEGKTASEISPMMKGPIGSTVRITVERPYTREKITVTLTREKIRFPNVPCFSMVGNETGYIRLSGFTEGAGREVRDALLSLKDRGAGSIILDVRSNPGGLLIEAVEVMNLFVPKGQEIITTRGKSKQWEATYTCRNEPVDTLIPVAVLVNSGSASASEIVAGAMQDLDRGIIIGQRTFGKGLVQTTRSLSYNANLKLTTAKYYIPSGRCIQALDYANRRPDGSVGHIPDSLISEFRTRNGRIVKDGGGIIPDILVDQQQLSRMASNLIYSNLLFDYATKFQNTHPQIPKPTGFTLTDEVYAEFRNFLTAQNFTYETASENALQSLIRSAKAEKYYESAEPLITELEKNLSHNLDKDLNILKPEISMLLADEIIGRYYYQKGRIEYMLRDDDGLSGAVVILKNPSEYRKVLGIK
ncbi:MAG: S41 family peptidase [Bacteroidota bacterium]